MDRVPIEAILAIDDHRRPTPRAAAVARRLGVLGNVPTTLYTIAADEVGPTDIVDLLAHRDGGTVLVMDVHGGGFPGDRLRDDDAEAVIAAGRVAVLAIGPRAESRSGPDALVVAIDHSSPGDAALDFGARWRNTFSPSKCAVVMLDAPSGWADSDDSEKEVIVGHGFDGLVEHVVTIDPAKSVCATASMHADPVIVVAAPCAPGISHWFATARRLIRTAPCPVAVVPNRR
jgi:hypothetical protein